VKLLTKEKDEQNMYQARRRRKLVTFSSESIKPLYYLQDLGGDGRIDLKAASCECVEWMRPSSGISKTYGSVEIDNLFDGQLLEADYAPWS
jgi:hypothetical protein